MRLLSFPTLPLLLLVLLHHGTVSSVEHRVSPLSQLLGLPLKPKQRALPLSKLLRGPKKTIPKTTFRSYSSSSCDAVYQTFTSCLATDTLDDGEECIACYNGQLPDEYEDCKDLASIVCSAINACDVECGGCTESFAEFQSCEYSDTTECGPFTCPPDNTDTDVQCDTAEDALVNCIETTGDGTDACLSCIEDTLPAKGLSCQSAPGYFSALSGVCPECGSCAEEFANFLSCSDSCGSGGCGGTSDRSQDSTNFINSKSYMGVDLSPTGTSPEELALQWLIHDDPLQLNVGSEVVEFRLLQRYSLLTLWFQGDSGTTWYTSTNWLTADECTWHGITCQSGVVTVVYFYGNGLQGSLSPDLGLLTDLTVLDLRYNSLSGSLPSEIGLWTKSKEFDVYNNALTGSLPSEIGLWTNLEKFSVGENNLTGSLPSEIGLWTNLKEFWVYNNTLMGSLPSQIGLWTNLEGFYVWGNALTGSLPSEIGLWTNLERFFVHDNALAGSLPSKIGLWTNLEMFYVSYNALTGTIPATIANWKLIESAYFGNNNFSGSMPNGICEFITGTDELEADCDLELTCSCCTECE